MTSSSRESLRLRALCLALLLVNIIYCVATTASGRQPAWGMFSKVEHVEYTLEDRDGLALDLREFIQPVAYITDPVRLEQYAACVCTQVPERRPLTLRLPETGAVVQVCGP